MDNLFRTDRVSVPPSGASLDIYSKDGDRVSQVYLAPGVYTGAKIISYVAPGQTYELSSEAMVMERHANIRANVHHAFESSADPDFRPERDPVALALQQKMRSVSTLEKKMQRMNAMLERSLKTQSATLREKQAEEERQKAEDEAQAKAAEEKAAKEAAKAKKPADE